MRPRHVAASVLVAALLVVQLVLVTDGARVPQPATSAIVLILTGGTILLLTDARTAPDAVDWLQAGLSALATISATVSLAVDHPVLLLTISTATTLALWAMHVAEHTTFSTTQPGNTEGGRAAAPAHPPSSLRS